MRISFIISVVIFLMLFLSMPAFSEDCPGSLEARSGPLNQDTTIRIRQNSWKNNYVVAKTIGSKIKVDRRKKKRKWYCLWLCKVWSWDDWRGNLSITVKYYDGSRRFLFQENKSASNIHELKSRKLRSPFSDLAEQSSTGGKPGSGTHGAASAFRTFPEGVQASGSGKAEVWRFFIYIFPYKPSVPDRFVERVNQVEFSGCTGKGQQPR